MAVRLQEVHPSIVHYPLALLPVAVGADLVASVTGSETLAEVGRTLMPIAAASTVLAAVTGLVAQEEVKAQGEAADLLATHRTLNLSLVTLSTAMAAYRLRREKPSVGYLALALAGLGAMGYSAYLGGKMVYEHGLGVKPADGLREGDSPELLPTNAREVARRVGRDIEQGVGHALDDMRSGKVLPAVGHRHEREPAARRLDGTLGGPMPTDGAGAIESMP
jgi:uncharacterized membrane protein